MKTLTILLAMCSVWMSRAQDGTIGFDNLEVPNTPAFILLDEAPSTIQRPNSSRAFALDLIQDITNDGVLDNIAIEVTPLWMIKHTNLSPARLYGLRSLEGEKSNNQNPFAKLRQASISAAYVKSKDSVVNISIGARATIFELKREKDLADFKASVFRTQDLLKRKADFIDEYMNLEGEPDREDFNTEEDYNTALSAWKDERMRFELKYGKVVYEPDPFDYPAGDPQYEKDKAEYNRALNSYVDKRKEDDGYMKEYEAEAKKFNQIINRKPILAVDLAVAYNQRFYGNTFDNNQAGRFGVWSTVAASTFLDKDPDSPNYFNLYAFFRYLEDAATSGVTLNSTSDRFDAFDLGVKGELEFKKLSVGYEYLNRSGDMEGYRSVGTIRYQLWQDVYLTGSFGNNFEDSDDLVSLFGIKWGINHPFQSVNVNSADPQ